MAKNKSSAVRKLDPQTLEVIPDELAQIVGKDAQVEVAESEGTKTVETAKPAGVNPVAQAGHSMEALMKEHKNFSGVIRFLASQNFKVGDIAKFMNKRYQHVRNVLNTPAKKASAPASAPATSETK